MGDALFQRSKGAAAADQAQSDNDDDEGRLVLYSLACSLALSARSKKRRPTNARALCAAEIAEKNKTEKNVRRAIVGKVFSFFPIKKRGGGAFSIE